MLTLSGPPSNSCVLLYLIAMETLVFPVTNAGSHSPCCFSQNVVEKLVQSKPWTQELADSINRHQDGETLTEKLIPEVR